MVQPGSQGTGDNEEEKVDLNRLSMGEKVAGASGVALFFIMFIFDWFGNDFGGANAWQSFGLIDLILFVTLVAAIALAFMAAGQQSVNLPVALSAVVAALGILATVLVLFRILSPPDFGVSSDALDGGADIGRKIGVFLGLIASAGIAYGGWVSMQQEGVSFGGESDRLRGDTGGGAGSGSRSGTGGGTPPSSGGGTSSGPQ